MKLIIDISERDYKNVSRIVDMGIGTNVDEAIKNGTPLDDVEAEIRDLYVGYRHGYEIMADVLQILDNIGKAESETN